MGKKEGNEMSVLKYDKKIYETIELTEEIKNHIQKLVKTKKDHICSLCGKEIPKGDYAIFEKGIVEGKWRHCYTCIDCANKYIEKCIEIYRGIIC